MTLVICQEKIEKFFKKSTFFDFFNKIHTELVQFNMTLVRLENDFGHIKEIYSI